MSTHIEFHFVNDFDQEEFMQASAYWVNDAAALRNAVKTVISRLQLCMKLFDKSIYCIGECFEFEGQQVHVVFERAAQMNQQL